MQSGNSTNRIQELATGNIGRLLWKYSLPAVIGTVVTALYNIIDSIVIGQAIDDPNVVSGIAVTFPVMNLVTAFGTLIGIGSTTRISIVLGQKDMRGAQQILGNSVILTLLVGIFYVFVFECFLDPILMMFGASPYSLPYAREFIKWVMPGMVLMNLTFSYNNVMRATGYPGKAMITNIIGAVLNAILAPLFLFGFHWGIRGAAIATDISMLVTAYFVISHFFRKDSLLHFVRGIFSLKWKVVMSIIYIGMSPFLINVAGAAVNAIVNSSLLKYGGDNAIAAVVVFNRYVTVFVFIVLGICQGMQPIIGYNYGAGKYDRLFKTLTLACISATVVTTLCTIVGALSPRPIAAMFMQDESQIECAVNCIRITTVSFWIVGFQIVSTNFFQSLGMAVKSIFLSLTRQIIFMVPMLFVLPPYFGLDGVWATFPISDFTASLLTAGMLIWQVRHIKAVDARQK